MCVVTGQMWMANSQLRAFIIYVGEERRSWRIHPSHLYPLSFFFFSPSSSYKLDECYRTVGLTWVPGIDTHLSPGSEMPLPLSYFKGLALCIVFFCSWSVGLYSAIIWSQVAVAKNGDGDRKELVLWTMDLLTWKGKVPLRLFLRGCPLDSLVGKKWPIYQ